MAEPAKKRIKVSHRELTKEFGIEEGSLDHDNRSWIASEFGLPPVGLKVQPDGTDTGVRLIFEGVTDNAEYTIAGAALQKEAASATLPAPASTQNIRLPDLSKSKFETNQLLNVEGFKEMVAANTVADRPIYLRQHLLAVHDKAVEALESKEKRLVSLVGCPGTGKTWCGWLVAYTLHKEKKKKVLHVTIRSKVVTVVQNFDTKKVYEDVDAWKSTMLKQLLTESKCDVCFIDVGDKTPSEVNDVFQGVRSILELGSFPDVKFFGMVSGHGEENIVGKQFNIQALTQKMVLWSWSQQEFRGYCELFNIGKDDSDKLKEEVYDTCGGSIRGCFAVDQVKQEISTALGNLNEKATGRFLLEVKRSTTDGDQRSRLLAFFPNLDAPSFAQGIASVKIVPRSAYVIHLAREETTFSPNILKDMYERMLPRNPGAAGTAFEMLVHSFWSSVMSDVTLVLHQKEDESDRQDIRIPVKGLQTNNVHIENYDKKGDSPLSVVPDLTGYFTPKDFKYPVLDSILRYKENDALRILAIQISIGEKHGHGKPRENALLGGEKPRLALWDYIEGNRKCTWTPATSDYCDLCYVTCKQFDDWLSKIK